VRKKPVELHLLAGTYRQDRHGNRGLPTTIPKCPAGMTPSARQHWRRLARTLAQAGLISQIDGLSLRLLAESIDLYLTASSKVTGNNLVVKTVNGNVIQNPFLAIRNRAWEQVTKLAGSFGLTPADRNGMSFTLAPNPNSIEAFARQRDPPKDKSRFFR
jgi:P27 family predicted phage terminase small subunit